MRWLARLGLVFLCVLLVAFLMLVWVFGTEGGLRWAIERGRDAADGRLTIEGASGTLAGAVRVERLSWNAPGLKIEARDILASADLLAALSGRLALDPLEARSLELDLRETGAPPGKPALPGFGISLRNVAIERLALAQVTLLEVRLSHLEVDQAVSAAGSFRRPDERYPAEVAFTLGGALERLELAADLKVAEVPVSARASLRPFEAQRIETLAARAGPLDLSRFQASLPRTQISATLEARRGADGTIAGSLAAANAAHGPLDQERMPVARLETRFSSADLASATPSASLEHLLIVASGGGTLEGKGRVDAKSARAELRAAGIDLRALHSTLRRTRLDGPLELRLTQDEQVMSGRLSQDDISVEADLTRRGKALEIRRLHARAAGGELSGAGRLDLEAFSFDAKMALAGFDPAAFGDYPSGRLNASLAASGDRRAVDLTWTTRESTLLGRALESRGAARVSPERASRVDAEVRFGAARASARGALGASGDVLAWRFETPQIDELAPGFGGALAASGTLSGSWKDPLASGTARAGALRLPGGLRVDEARAKFEGRLARHEVDLSVAAPEVELDARLRGGWDAQAGWSGEIASLANRGTYPLRLLAPAPLRASPAQVELGRVEASLGEGRLVVAGARWQPQRLSSSGEFTGLPAQWLVALTGLAQRIGGSLRLDGAWSLAASPKLEGTLNVRRASGDLTVDEVTLGLGDAALDGRFVEGRLAAQGRIATRFATLGIEGTLGPAQDGAIAGPSSPVSLRAQAEIASIRPLLRPFVEDVRIDGRARGEVRAQGTLREIALAGEVSADAIGVELPQHGVSLKDGRLRAQLKGDALEISELSIRGAGGGSFEATGTLPLRPAEKAAARLEWRARGFNVIERPDMRIVASGQGEAGFDGKRLALSGDLRADRGHIELARDRLPQLGEDVVIVGQPPARRKGEVQLPLALDLMLDLGDQLTLRTQGFDGRVAGRVQLQTTAQGELRAYGEVRAVNATFSAYGQRLQVDPGTLIFAGPLDNPGLQITAWRRNQAVEAGVQITGTARAPRVQLVSYPPVSESERLSWLVLGRAPGDATQADLGLLQAAAAGLMTRGDAVPIDQRLARSVGLDEVGLRGSGEVEDRVVAFGKRLSDRVYVSYERGLGAVASNLVKLDYALSQRWSVRAETGSTNTGTPTSGWGLFYRFSWD